jgi:hypothetical protein
MNQRTLQSCGPPDTAWRDWLANSTRRAWLQCLEDDQESVLRNLQLLREGKPE